MIAVAKRLEVSSNYLARVCESLNVPHPPRGHWARKAAGEEMAVPPLPPASPGDTIEWVRGTGVPKRASFADYSPPPSKARSRSKPRTSEHPLVSAWRAHLEQASPDEVGYLWPQKKNLLDAFVTKGMIRSSANALNAVLNELENRGHTVALEAISTRPPLEVRPGRVVGPYDRSRSWEPGRATIVSVANIRIGLSLYESCEHVRVRRTGADHYVRIKDLPPVRRYQPQSPTETDLMRDMATGRLVLRAYSPIYDTQWSGQWQENGAEDQLVARVAEIVDALEAAAPRIAQLAAEAEEREAERRRKAEAEHRAWRRQEQARARAEARRKALEELRAIAKAWQDADAFEAFFDEIHRRGDNMDPGARAELESRIASARDLLGSADAIQRFLKWRPPSARPDPGEDDEE